MLRYLVFALVMLTAVQSAYSSPAHTHIVNRTVSHQHEDGNVLSDFHTHIVERITHVHGSNSPTPTTFTIVDGEWIGTHSHDVFQVENELSAAEKISHPHIFTYKDYSPALAPPTGESTQHPVLGATEPPTPEDPALVPILAGTAPPVDPTTPAGGSTDNPINTGRTSTVLGAAQSQQSVYNNPATPNPNEATMPPQNTSVPIEVVEYMVRDWSLHSGGGLPQWVELYNPNPDPMNLSGYTFQYATRNAANDPFEIKSVSISEATIAPESTLIFVTRKIRIPTDSAIQDSQIYNLKIDNVLKRGWKIITPDNIVIHQIGQVFGGEADPVAPLHQDGTRVSYHVQKSVDPTESYYYGAERDIGSPGFHEPAIPAAPALIRPKKVGVWADLKRGVQR